MIPTVAFAPGSLDTNDLSGLLKQTPEVAQPFLAAFELEASASATRLGSHFTHLSAARIGPYEVMARARGSGGPFNVHVVICTATSFLDDQGKVTKRESAAVKIEEHLLGLIIQPSDGDLRCAN
jgi:hypothetical protein